MRKIGRAEADREMLLQSMAGDIARTLYDTNDPTDEQWWPLYQALKLELWNWSLNTHRMRNPQRYYLPVAGHVRRHVDPPSGRRPPRFGLDPLRRLPADPEDDFGPSSSQHTRR
jgi:hypothetical protein